MCTVEYVEYEQYEKNEQYMLNFQAFLKSVPFWSLGLIRENITIKL